MFIVYAVTWSYWFPWSGVPLENMWKNGVSSAAWEYVAILGLCCCHGLCLWLMFLPEMMLVLPTRAIMMSLVCAVCTNHVQLHDTCCYRQWEPYLKVRAIESFWLPFVTPKKESRQETIEETYGWRKMCLLQGDGHWNMLQWVYEQLILDFFFLFRG